MNNQKIIELAKELKINDISISRNKSNSTSLKYENGFFKESNQALYNGANITSYLNGNRVSRSLDYLNETDVKYVLQEIKEVTKYKTKEVEEKPLNPNGLEYLSYSPYPFTPPSIEEAKKLIKKIVEEINETDKRILKDNTIGFFNVSSTESSLENTEGIQLKSSSGLYFKVFIAVFVKDNSDSEMIQIGRLCKKIDDIDIDDIKKQLKEEINLKLIKKDIKGGKYDIIFDRGVFNDLLDNFLMHMNARSVIDKISIWENKIDQKVASSKVTLIDKPILEEFGEFNTYDNDGYPTKTRKFIDQGVLTSFVHNRKTAELLKQENTGNSKGANPGLHMLLLKPGQKNDAELISSIQEGFLITQLKGMHSGINSTSGDFSLEFSGNLIQDGKIKEAIKAGVISGNFFKDVFLEVAEVSSEIEMHKFQFQPMVKLSKKLPISV